jgi:hypothetical protein
LFTRRGAHLSLDHAAPAPTRRLFTRRGADLSLVRALWQFCKEVFANSSLQF